MSPGGFLRSALLAVAEVVKTFGHPRYATKLLTSSATRNGRGNFCPRGQPLSRPGKWDDDALFCEAMPFFMNRSPPGSIFQSAQPQLR